MSWANCRTGVAGVAAHTANCASCQFELTMRDGTTDSLILQIRRPPRTDALNDEPHLSIALRQAQGLTAAAPRAGNGGTPGWRRRRRPTSWAASAPTASSD